MEEAFKFFVISIGKFTRSIDVESEEKRNLMSFEFGCYLLSNLDYWLHMKDGAHRREIMNYFISVFTSSFAEILNIPTDELKDILFARLPLYGELKQSTGFGSREFSRENFEKYYGIVADIMINIVKDGIFSPYSSAAQVPITLNMEERFKLMSALAIFEENFLTKDWYEQVGGLV